MLSLPMTCGSISRKQGTKNWAVCARRLHGDINISWMNDTHRNEEASRVYHNINDQKFFEYRQTKGIVSVKATCRKGDISIYRSCMLEHKCRCSEAVVKKISKGLCLVSEHVVRL